jgi:hypothetical protein
MCFFIQKISVYRQNGTNVKAYYITLVIVKDRNKKEGSYLLPLWGYLCRIVEVRRFRML